MHFKGIDISNKYLPKQAISIFARSDWLRNSRYPRLLVDFEKEVKMTGSARAKNRKKKFTL